MAKTDEPIIEPLSQRLERAPPVHQPNIRLKSCLKTPGKNGNGNRGTARVKFMLGGKETETTFPVSGRNNASSSSCVAMEFVSKNTQNIVPSTLPPILPLSSQNSKPKHVNNQVDHVEPPLDQSQVNISEEMMKLLLRCNDVVANVKGLLGYVPYHPL
ncbi:unnamed protein product [Arabis nemorensis]|uniref:Uncharacterized protein n=1 Tax=Arabis nemorensis TaxID=586526 RepID=A0A565B4G9_9BRAS|nr:unnamed protein product [Arabis nemorensis]